MNRSDQERMLEIMSYFETSGKDGWDQVTGNFDGYLLTCGILGFTIRSKSQQPLVRKYLELYGEESLKEYMPKHGTAYIVAISDTSKGLATAWRILGRWADKDNYRVKEPMRSELKRFWGSEGMRRIQFEACQSRFEWAQKHAGLIRAKSSFAANLSFFDYRVNNGGMKGVNVAAVVPLTGLAFADWLEGVSKYGYQQRETAANVKLLRERFEAGTSRRDAKLFGIIKERCSKSRKQFHGVTASRKMICAIGEGHLNGTKMKFDVSDSEPVTEPIPTTPKSRKFTSPCEWCKGIERPKRPDNDWGELSFMAADLQKQGIPEHVISKFLTYWRDKTNANYGYFLDYSLHSSKKRFWVYSIRQKTVRRFRVAHGAGSDRNHNGYADQFSNTTGSHMSSLGLLETGDTYNGRNGYSLKLHGKDDSNDKMLSRYIVIHGSDYVSDSFTARFGKSGRSQGCPALDHKVTKSVIDKLKQGSPGFHFYNP